ncbi:MAG: ABC transporter substrate-binding protein [Anaerolineae bacterium]|nr:ABC transporter substrate-binding protein [Anaerolineae bacterium]
MHKRVSWIIGFVLLFTLSGAAVAQDAPIELTMWTWKIFHVPGLEAVAANFEADTGIKVTVQAYNPDDVYRTRITTSAQSGELPDILSYWSGGQWELAATDNLLELTDKVDEEWASEFLPGTYEKQSVMTQTTYDNCQADVKCTYSNLAEGQVFSVPYLAGQAFFVYGNKALMEEAGLDPNAAPATAEEWLDMMKTIKDKTGVAGLVTGVQNPDVLQFWLFNPLLITSCGPEVYDAIYGGKDSFTNPCALNVLNWINEISTNDLWMPGILSTNIDPADVAFSQERAAFDLGGTYTLGFLIAQGMDPENIISFPVPPLEGSALDTLEIAPAPLIDAMVTTNSEHPDEALQFLHYLTSPAQMELFAKTVGDLPAVKVSSDPELVGSVMPGLLNAISDYSPFQDATAPQLKEPSDVLKLGLQQFITSEITPEELAPNIDAANEAAWATRTGG